MNLVQPDEVFSSCHLSKLKCLQSLERKWWLLFASDLSSWAEELFAICY